AETSIDEADAAALERLSAWCEALERRWSEVTAPCENMPSTLVHADFVAENIRVRGGERDQVLLPFDWGISGWGPPARDLVAIDLAVYGSTIREHWPALSDADLRRLAAVGKVFRMIAAIHRACMSLPYAPVQKVLGDVRFLAVRA